MVVSWVNWISHQIAIWSYERETHVIYSIFLGSDDNALIRLKKKQYYIYNIHMRITSVSWFPIVG